MYKLKSENSSFCKAFKLIYLLGFLLFFNISSSFASDGEHTKPEKFDAGETIMHHILDAHEWHFLNFHIPLPVILYSSENGFDVFLSNKFVDHDTHEPVPYEGYAMEDRHIIREDGASFYDISLTKNTISMLVSMFLMLFIFISIANSYKRNKNQAPKGLQSLLEPIIIFVRDDIAKACIGEKNYNKYLPFLLTVFFFVWINNLMGLIPIPPFGANVTGNIAITMVLALFTFAITTFSGNKQYWRHVFAMPGVPVGVLAILTPIEIMGVFLKPFVLMIRLFANITAGHIIILSFFSLVFIFAEMNQYLGLGVGIFSTVFAIFMSFLELLVAFIQAYVFTLLSAIYFGMAIEEAHEH